MTPTGTFSNRVLSAEEAQWGPGAPASIRSGTPQNPYKKHQWIGSRGQPLVLLLLLGLGRKLFRFELEHRAPELLELLLRPAVALLKAKRHRGGVVALAINSAGW